MLKKLVAVSLAASAVLGLSAGAQANSYDGGANGQTTYSVDIDRARIYVYDGNDSARQEVEFYLEGTASFEQSLGNSEECEFVVTNRSVASDCHSGDVYFRELNNEVQARVIRTFMRSDTFIADKMMNMSRDGDVVVDLRYGSGYGRATIAKDGVDKFNTDSTQYVYPAGENWHQFKMGRFHGALVEELNVILGDGATCDEGSFYINSGSCGGGDDSPALIDSMFEAADTSKTVPTYWSFPSNALWGPTNNPYE